MKGKNEQIQIGNRVTVAVKSLDVARERINLEFKSF
jgi:ribosomal protein S1